MHMVVLETFPRQGLSLMMEKRMELVVVTNIGEGGINGAWSQGGTMIMGLRSLVISPNSVQQRSKIYFQCRIHKYFLLLRHNIGIEAAPLPQCALTVNYWPSKKILCEFVTEIRQPVIVRKSVISHHCTVVKIRGQTNLQIDYLKYPIFFYLKEIVLSSGCIVVLWDILRVGIF